MYSHDQAPQGDGLRGGGEGQGPSASLDRALASIRACPNLKGTGPRRGGGGGLAHFSTSRLWWPRGRTALRLGKGAGHLGVNRGSHPAEGS